MKITLIRHGESQANTGEVSPIEMGDAYIPLTEKGRRQAEATGAILGTSAFNYAQIYCSPYVRTRMTLEGLLKGANLNKEGLDVYEDPRLREEERGFAPPNEQMPLRERHGWFYYRHHGGESSADCYDRVSSFIDSMYREIGRQGETNVLIVAHGAVIRLFVMRFLHLTVEQFESLKNPANGSVVTIGLTESIDAPVFSSGKWSVEGLELRG